MEEGRMTCLIRKPFHSIRKNNRCMQRLFIKAKWFIRAI